MSDSPKERSNWDTENTTVTPNTPLRHRIHHCDTGLSKLLDQTGLWLVLVLTVSVFIINGVGDYPCQCRFWCLSVFVRVWSNTAVYVRVWSNTAVFVRVRGCRCRHIGVSVVVGVVMSVCPWWWSTRVPLCPWSLVSVYLEFSKLMIFLEIQQIVDFLRDSAKLMIFLEIQ